MVGELALSGGDRTAVSRWGEVVFRAARPWSATVINLLRHLESAEFLREPRVMGSGFDDQGRETLSFLEGEIIHPHPWSDSAMYTLGGVLKEFIDASHTFVAPQDAIWQPWFGRAIDDGTRVIGHCDTGPWKMVSRDVQPFALIDWEVSGPVARGVELAQACWLNAQLVDDDVAERVGLSSLQK